MSAKAISSSDLRQRATIMKPVDTANGSGGFTRTYANVLVNEPVKFVYAPPAKKGDEIYTQQQIRAAVFSTMTMRYHPSVNIDDTMRVVFGTRTFEVRAGFTVDEYSQWITLQLEELQGKGTLH